GCWSSELFRHGVDSAGRYTGSAHDAGVDIVKLRRTMRWDSHRGRRVFFDSARRGHKPRMDVQNLRPERSHNHHEVFDNWKILQWRHCDRPMPLEFLAQRCSAGKLFAPVNLHRTGSADCGAAGIAQRKAPVALVLEADQRIEDSHATSDVETELFCVRRLIHFGIEPLDGKSEVHGTECYAISIQPSASGR